MNIGRLRGKTRLTREGWYYSFVLAFVLGGALLREINLLLILAGMLLGPLVLSWWVAGRCLRKLSIERRVPRGVGAGDVVEVSLVAAHRGRRGTLRMVSIEDSVRRIAPAGDDSPASARVLFAEIPAGASRRLTYRLRLPRGRYRVGPLRVVTRFPLGLFVRTIELRQPEEMLVFPQLGRLPPQNNLRQETWLGSRRAPHRHGALEADFYGLRDWRAGDSRRWIHWRTSARRGTLMVRQFEQPRLEDLHIRLELWQPAKPELRHLENVELAVSYVATLLAEACRWGNCRLILAVAGREQAMLQGAASRAFLEEALATLAVAEASPTVTFRGLNGASAPRHRNTLIVGTRYFDGAVEGYDAATTSRASIINVDSDQFAQQFVAS